MGTRVLAAALGAAALLAASATGRAQAPERAATTSRFVDSVGINVHWTYGGSRYADSYPQVRRLLVLSGIRHVRADTSRAQDLAAAGILTMPVADVPTRYTRFPAFAPADGGDDTIRAFVADVKAHNRPLAAIEWVEGPNEPDNFWPLFHKSYKGQGWRPQAPGEDEAAYRARVLAGVVAGDIAFQRDLYAALKRDPATRALTVVGSAPGGTYAPNTAPNPWPVGALAGAVDLGNFHPYPYGGNFDGYGGTYDTIGQGNTGRDYTHAGNFPSVNMDADDPNDTPAGSFGRLAFTAYTPPFAPRPMAATETGYPTHRSGASEWAQGRYLPRLFCEYFAHGVRRTYWYELVDEDEYPDPQGDNPECHYGLVRRDLTPKPAYVALKSLLTLLRDPGPRAATFTPGALAYGLSVAAVRGYREPNSGAVSDYDRTRYVHHLLLQKSDGVFYLLLWHEVSDEDTGVVPHRQIQPPALPATLTLPPAIRSATVYAYDAAEVLRPIPAPLVAGRLRLAVPDQVTIIRLALGNKASLTPGAASSPPGAAGVGHSARTGRRRRQLGTPAGQI